MPDSNPEDPLLIHLLVVRAQVGDEDAFTKLYELFSGRTFRYLNSLVGDEAADVHQELWLSVYRDIRHVGNPTAFRTWLYRAAHHRAIDFLRANRRRQQMTDDVEIDEVEVTDEQPTIDIDEADLEQALDSLSGVHREVVLLRYRAEMSYSEIALVIGCPIGTVRTRLHHAKRRLHELLNRGYEK